MKRARIPVLAGITFLAVLHAPPSLAQEQPQAPALGWNYNSLKGIDRKNAASLRPTWQWATGREGAETGAPLSLASGALTVFTPFPHELTALDVTAPKPRVLWKVAPEADLMAERLRCCEPQEHGPVLAGGRLVLTTLDGHVLSLDPADGHVAWNVGIADPAKGESLSGPPAAAGSTLLVGGGNGGYGARGWIAALDAQTGRTLWKQFSTGPDHDVGIGPGFNPGTGGQGENLGTATWPPGAWEHGGGAVAGRILFDPDSNLIFHGTGSPPPWNPDQRTGANNWTSGLFARDPETGAARWFVGLNPHDPFGWGGLGGNVLVDRDWQGENRKLLVHADANGFLFVLDRLTGEVLATDPFAENTAAGPSDTALPSPAAARLPHTNVQVRNVCPAWIGATGTSIAYSPETGLVYIPVRRLCMDFEARQANFIAGTPFLGANIRVYPAADGPGGRLVAWDIAARRPAWSVDERFPLAGGVLATAGGLVFYGTLDGRLKAVDAATGKPLWEFATGSTLVGQPTMFQGPDGREGLAVVAGPGGPFGLALSRETDSLDATAGLGLADALGDLPKPADTRGTLWVFRLP